MTSTQDALLFHLMDAQQKGQQAEAQQHQVYLQAVGNAVTQMQAQEEMDQRKAQQEHLNALKEAGAAAYAAKIQGLPMPFYPESTLRNAAVAGYQEGAQALTKTELDSYRKDDMRHKANRWAKLKSREEIVGAANFLVNFTHTIDMETDPRRRQKMRDNAANFVNQHIGGIGARSYEDVLNAAASYATLASGAGAEMAGMGEAPDNALTSTGQNAAARAGVSVYDPRAQFNPAVQAKLEKPPVQRTMNVEPTTAVKTEWQKEIMGDLDTIRLMSQSLQHPERIKEQLSLGGRAETFLSQVGDVSETVRFAIAPFISAERQDKLINDVSKFEIDDQLVSVLFIKAISGASTTNEERDRYLKMLGGWSKGGRGYIATRKQMIKKVEDHARARLLALSNGIDLDSVENPAMQAAYEGMDPKTAKQRLLPVIKQIANETGRSPQDVGIEIFESVGLY